jgi:hypothetical protein
MNCRDTGGLCDQMDPRLDHGTMAPRYIRMFFHAAGTFHPDDPTGYKPGGSNGGTIGLSPEKNYPENRGLDIVEQHLRAVGNQHPECSFADLVILGGVVAVGELSNGQMRPNFCPGRIDHPANSGHDVCPFAGRLPSLNSQVDAWSVRHIFGRMGFKKDCDIVALMGSHSVGYTHPDVSGLPNQPWDSTPFQLDTTMFRELLQHSWTRHTSPKPHYLREECTSTRPCSYCATQRRCVQWIMLEHDMLLRTDPGFAQCTNLYANNAQRFRRDYIKAINKMGELGVPCMRGARINNSDTVCSGVSGSECEYTCHPGYSKVGRHICSCSTSGFRTFIGGKCQANVCAPVAIRNAASTPCAATTGETCSFRCLPGYTAQGKQMCSRNGKMMGGECKPNTCNSIQLPHAVSTCEATTGSICTWLCEAGYEARGTLTCSINGSFLGNGVCANIRCDDNLVVAHKISGCQGVTGDVCSFNCTPGFRPIGQRVCTAIGEFTGGTCDRQDVCTSGPCVNGAECIEMTAAQDQSSYRCTCVPGYSGPHCGTDINECSSNPCNSGTCTDHVARYSCKCNRGYTGVQCNRSTNSCDSTPCSNGGRCYDGHDEFRCDCIGTGFHGPTCAIDIDECALNPPPCGLHGNCTDLINGLTCDCDPGYSGDTCDGNIDECRSAPCQHGGQCMDDINSFHCVCRPNYGGSTCSDHMLEAIAIQCHATVQLYLGEVLLFMVLMSTNCALTITFLPSTITLLFATVHVAWPVAASTYTPLCTIVLCVILVGSKLLWCRYQSETINFITIGVVWAILTVGVQVSVITENVWLAICVEGFQELLLVLLVLYLCRQLCLLSPRRKFPSSVWTNIVLLLIILALISGAWAYAIETNMLGFHPNWNGESWILWLDRIRFVFVCIAVVLLVCIQIIADQKLGQKLDNDQDPTDPELGYEEPEAAEKESPSVQERMHPLSVDEDIQRDFTNPLKDQIVDDPDELRREKDFDDSGTVGSVNDLMVINSIKALISVNENEDWFQNQDPGMQTS